jgi:chemotaxis signal transduction protein
MLKFIKRFVKISFEDQGCFYIMEDRLVFDLAQEHYEVNITTVESIIKMQTITTIPRAPDCIKGMINLRGKVLPVIDLHQRFGLASTTLDKKIPGLLG